MAGGEGEEKEGKDMSKDEELKPCPFCGSKELKVAWTTFGGMCSVPLKFVECIGCNVWGQRDSKEKEAIRKWNTRA